MFAFDPTPPTVPVFSKLIGGGGTGRGAEVVLTLSAD